MSGSKLTFNIENVSLLDINNLIDKGLRFDLKPDLEDSEYDNLEEYLNNGSNSVAIPIERG